MLDISPIILGYDRKAVLRFGGMRLEKGGQCLILGPSGSGKTTLLYAIAGLVEVLQGRVEVNGTDLSSISEPERDHFRGKHIGMIFQTLHLVKSLSVVDNLMLASYIAGVPQDRKQAEDVLRQLGIHEKKDVLPGQLSQGQAQRVAIARAILHMPPLLLADEPTSSLDDRSCEAVITLIQKAAKDNGAALVISTHDSRVKSHFTNVIKLEDAA